MKQLIANARAGTTGEARRPIWPQVPEGDSDAPSVGADDDLSHTDTEETPVIELRGLARTFPGPPDVEAVRPTSMTVRAGDYLSIIGPSGSGKSTLLHLLGLLDRPTAGEYWLNGIETTAANEKERSAIRASYIGFVFQAFHLLPARTVLDNVILSMIYNGIPRKDREPMAREALARVHLENRVDFYPTVLSGGERQRVAIARAVASKPQILLADEPTGNLDSHNSAQIMDLFDELSADGQTLLVITHDRQVSARARRVVTITDGQLLEGDSEGARSMSGMYVPGDAQLAPRQVGVSR